MLKGPDGTYLTTCSLLQRIIVVPGCVLGFDFAAASLELKQAWYTLQPGVQRPALK